MNQVLNRVLFSLLLTLVVAAPAAAQEGMVPPPEAATDGNGALTGTGTVTLPDGTVVPLTGTQTCASTAAGWGITCNLSVSGLPGGGTLEVAQLWGFNTGDGLFHFYAVTNMGEVHDHFGGMQDGLMVLEHQGPMNGQLFNERIEAQISDTQIVFHVTPLLGAQPQGVFDVTLTRQP
jgi:hypothetical protein